jgi:hypothetical protein
MRASLLCGFFFSRNVNRFSSAFSSTTTSGDKYMPSHVAIAGEQLRFEEEEEEEEEVITDSP